MTIGAKRPSAFGRNLRTARLAAGLTPDELGVSIGDKDGNNIRRWETSVRIAMPHAETLARLAKVLHVSMEWLVTSEGDGPGERDQDALEAHIAAMIHRYQAQVDAGVSAGVIQDYWELLVHAFELNAARYPTVSSMARSLARIAAGNHPPTRPRVDRAEKNRNA